MTLTHAQIIDRAEGIAKFARAIGVNPNTAKPWRRLNSIPAPYWNAVAKAGLATLEQLAAAAEHRAKSQQGKAA